MRGMQKLAGDNLKVVPAECSTLCWVVFVASVITRHAQARSHLELKTQFIFCLVSLRLSIEHVISSEVISSKVNLSTEHLLIDFYIATILIDKSHRIIIGCFSFCRMTLCWLSLH